MKIKSRCGFFFFFLFVLAAASQGAEDAADFADAQALIAQKIPCEDLTREQMERIGDYYMELMHPGELHEIMDERMGGEGSESLKVTHIRITQYFYCGQYDPDEASQGMMNTLMGRGRGMMGGQGPYGMTGPGMMGYANGYVGAYPLTTLLMAIVLMVIIIMGAAFLIWRMIKPGDQGRISPRKRRKA